MNVYFLKAVNSGQTCFCYKIMFKTDLDSILFNVGCV